MSSFGHNLRAVLALGLPLAASHLAQLSISVTDTLMIGWYGVDELAALSLAGPWYFVMFLMGQGFGIAVMPLVASAIATEDHRQIRRVTRMGLWVSVIAGLGTMPLLIFSKPILVGLGQEEQIAQMAQDYLRVAGWSLPLLLVAMVLKSYLSALEHAQIVLWATMAGFGLNIALNYAFIFGNLGAPELGIQGAAIASLGTTALTLLVLCLYAFFHSTLRRYQIFLRLWRPDWEAFGQVLRLGLPISLTALAESGLFTASAFMMGWLGEDALAAHGIALQIAAMTFMIHIGISSAATVLIGQAWGRGDAEAMRQAARATLVLSLSLVALTIFAFLSIPDLLIGAFLDPDDPARDRLIAIGRGLLAMAALFQLADAMQVVALGFLRGVQDTRLPMIFAVISYWVIGAPACYLLGFTFGLGGVGIWLGMAIGLSFAATSMMIRFWTGPIRKMGPA